MIASDAMIDVKPGVKVKVWTFNGTVPGPTLRFTRLISNKPEDHQTVLIGPGDTTIIEGKWQYPGSFLFHAHGLEEERGGMGCFYVIPTTNFTGETIVSVGMGKRKMLMKVIGFAVVVIAILVVLIFCWQ
jgi:FtsP/CotA-like multicopper oxidase with cupredoxin domain